MERVILAAEEVVAERPFTHPQHTRDDVQVMRQMWGAVRAHIQAINRRHPAGRYHFEVQERENGEVHQIVLANRSLLAHTRPAAVVGYFGQTRPEVDHTAINDLEWVLIQRMEGAKGLLVYYNCYWPDSGWGNLVIFTDEENKEQWGTDPVHREAVQLAPQHYFSVRLHNGWLPAGVTGETPLFLTRTRYLDFRQTPPWRAERIYHWQH